MAPKKTFLPLFFLLILLFSLFLFSLYHSSPPLSSPQPPLFSTHFQTPTPNFFVTIKLLTFDRLPSLSRCLHSLASADYGADKVNLHIFIDHFRNGSVNLDHKLIESREILDFVDGFSWKFGEKLVHYRTGNVGLQVQWLEAWWPGSDNEFAFIVEDDLELSPLYYKFLKGLIVNYYYNASNFSPWIYGASLQRPRFVPGKHGNKMQLDGETRLFLYQLVGTWGQLLFPKPWKEFRLWYDTHKTKGIKPYLDGMVTTGWYKKMGERIWTPWFIKFIHARGYFNIYTNFLHDRALSVSHRDAGVNYGKTAGPDSDLLDESSLHFNLLEMQPLGNLKWYDFCFREVIPGRIVKDSSDLGSVLNSLQKSETIVLVSLYGTLETVVRNLLCHFERLNIRNYIFLGPQSSLLHDLTRRGHPVVDADQFFNSIRSQKSIKFQESRLELMKEIIVKTYLIKKTLELKYNTWVVGGNTIPFSNSSFVDSYNPSYDFLIGTELFFVRSSSSAWELWLNEFISSLAQSEENEFVHVVEKSLEKKGVRMVRADEIGYGLNIDVGSLNGTSLRDGKKIAFWSSDLGLDLIQKKLQSLGLWIIDEDLSCTAVVCHQS